MTTTPATTFRDLVPISQVRKLLPANANGRDVSPRTVARWVHRGVAGRRLEAVRRGGRLYVAPEALEAFLAPVVCNPPVAEIVTPPAADRALRPTEQVRRLHEIEAAEEYLRQRGVLP
jgi:hypothetical protein